MSNIHNRLFKLTPQKDYKINIEDGEIQVHINQECIERILQLKEKFKIQRENKEDAINIMYID